MVLVLFGTQTGNSELVAAEVAECLEEMGEDTEVMDMGEAYPELLEEVERLIVPLCTWNDGTFPDNTVAFWEALVEVKPDCSQMRFAIIGLGDRLYDPYYQVAAYRLADKLTALGAQEAIEMFEIDGPIRRSHLRRLKRWTRKCLKAFEASEKIPQSPPTRS